MYREHAKTTIHDNCMYINQYGTSATEQDRHGKV